MQLGSRTTSVLSERRKQFADERRSDVKYQTLSIAYSATSQPQGLLRFGSTHCYPTIALPKARALEDAIRGNVYIVGSSAAISFAGTVVHNGP